MQTIILNGARSGDVKVDEVSEVLLSMLQRLGNGGAIRGKPLDKSGFAARNVRKALNLAAKDLSEGKVVSQEAVDLMAKPMVPKWLYLMVGNRNWKQWAKDFGSQDKMYNQP